MYSTIKQAITNKIILFLKVEELTAHKAKFIQWLFLVYKLLL